MEVIVVAAVGQGLTGHGIDRAVRQTTVVQGAVLAEEGRQVHVGRQLGLSQIQVIFAPEQMLLEFGGAHLQNGHFQTALPEHFGDISAYPQPQRVVGVQQEGHRCALQIGIGQGGGELQTVVAVAAGEACVVIGGQGRSGQDSTAGKVPIEILYDIFSVDGMGQSSAHIVIGKGFAVGVDYQIQEQTVFAVPDLIVAAVVRIGVGARVSADKTHIAKLKLIPHLAGGFCLHQRDKGRCDDQVGGIGAPPSCLGAQALAADGRIHHIRTGADGIGTAGLRCFDDGDIQQQGQVLIGRVQRDHHTAAFGGNGGNVLKTTAVICAFLCGFQTGYHIRGGEGGAIREAGGSQIEGIGLHIRGYLETVAEDGRHAVIPVYTEQTLIKQRQQRPVIKVCGGIGIQIFPGVVHHGQILFFHLFGGFGGIAVVGIQCVTGGDVGCFVLLTAGKQTERQYGAQEKRDDLLHTLPPLQTMMAP